jgi:hypothetical protein
VTNLNRNTRRVHGKTVGYLATIGCPKTPKGKRVATVVYTDLNGHTASSQSKSTCTV